MLVRGVGQLEGALGIIRAGVDRVFETGFFQVVVILFIFFFVCFVNIFAQEQG